MAVIYPPVIKLPPVTSPPAETIPPVSTLPPTTLAPADTLVVAFTLPPSTLPTAVTKPLEITLPPALTSVAAYIEPLAVRVTALITLAPVMLPPDPVVAKLAA